MCAVLREVISGTCFFFSMYFKNNLSNSEDQKGMPLPTFELLPEGLFCRSPLYKGYISGGLEQYLSHYLDKTQPI